METAGTCRVVVFWRRRRRPVGHRAFAAQLRTRSCWSGGSSLAPKWAPAAHFATCVAEVAAGRPRRAPRATFRYRTRQWFGAGCTEESRAPSASASATAASRSSTAGSRWICLGMAPAGQVGGVYPCRTIALVQGRTRQLDVAGAHYSGTELRSALSNEELDNPFRSVAFRGCPVRPKLFVDGC